jgi:hypothetical protein
MRLEWVFFAAVMLLGQAGTPASQNWLPPKANPPAGKVAVSRPKQDAGANAPRVISFTEAQPVFQSFADELPKDLQTLSRDQVQATWPAYVRRHDAEIRDRLLQGDEDSLVNLLLFGTSFTHQPRLTDEFVTQAEHAFSTATGPHSETNAAIRVLDMRVEDMARSLANPGANERTVYMRRLLESKGLRFETAASREKVRQYLVSSVARVRQEFREYQRTVEAARATGDHDTEMAVRSTLFQKRGISLDTSIMPDYALDESLKLMLDHGLLAKGSIRRVAVVGPGLDFTDKQEGYDFYPQQSTQAFALIDSLLRLGLSRKDELQVTSLDISPRVNQHLARIRQRARQGSSYVVQLPLKSDRGWEPGARAFWQHMGEFIGSPATPVAVPPSVGKLDIRALRIPAEVVLRVTPRDLDIVWQRMELPAGERYDLVVATNILVYYDEFQQALALGNLQSMIRENGFLLTNNGLPDVPTLQMKQVGHSSTAYSEKAADGDHIIWYQHSPK